MKACHAERNKSGRERKILYDLTHMWNLESKTKQKQDSETRSVGQWLPERKRVGASTKRVKRMKKYQLPVVKINESWGCNGKHQEYD